MRYLIGVGLIILGGVLTAVTGIAPFAIILMVGVFLFASLPDEAVFCDYIIANSEEALIRKRHYIVFLPFLILSTILTLNKAHLKIVWKEEYYKAILSPEKRAITAKLSRKEYIALRNAQRRIYASNSVSREFITKNYTPEDIGFQRKKRRLIIAGIFAALMLTLIVTPGGVYLMLIYEAIFVPMILLWIPAYQDAKILQAAYDRAVASYNQL